MFTVLLGFGVGLIAVSLNRRGFPLRDAKKVLAKRYAWLAAFGLVHAVFLFFGDIMFTYGVIALILILMIGFKDRTLLIIAGGLWGLLALMMVLAAVFAPADQLSMSVVDLAPEFAGYVQYLLFNLVFQLFNAASVPVVALAMLPAMIVGFVAARRGVHLAVERYRRVLWALGRGRRRGHAEPRCAVWLGDAGRSARRVDWPDGDAQPGVRSPHRPGYRSGDSAGVPAAGSAT